MNTETESETQIQKLTKTLMTAYSIKAGNSIIEKVGIGYESSNYEAVENWIKNNLLNPNDKLAESILPVLVDQFDDVYAGGIK